MAMMQVHGNGVIWDAGTVVEADVMGPTGLKGVVLTFAAVGEHVGLLALGK